MSVNGQLQCSMPHPDYRSILRRIIQRAGALKARSESDGSAGPRQAYPACRAILGNPKRARSPARVERGGTTYSGRIATTSQSPRRTNEQNATKSLDNHNPD